MHPIRPRFYHALIATVLLAIAPHAAMAQPEDGSEKAADRAAQREAQKAAYEEAMRQRDAAEARAKEEAEREATRKEMAAAEAKIAAELPQALGIITWKAPSRRHAAFGHFPVWRYTAIDIPEGDLTRGTISLEVETGSVIADKEGLTNHLRKEDMLNPAKFPKATITLGNVVPNPEGKADEGWAAYKATGEIDLIGVRQPLTMEFQASPAREDGSRRVKGTAIVNRDAHGVYTPYDPTSDRSPTDKVAIEVDVTLPMSLEQGAQLLEKLRTEARARLAAEKK
jgi:polyisoprenoid-binding protein YceI